MAESLQYTEPSGATGNEDESHFRGHKFEKKGQTKYTSSERGAGAGRVIQLQGSSVKGREEKSLWKSAYLGNDGK